MPTIPCPACQRLLALPDDLGGGWVCCPACRTPFEAAAGGGLGPRWVLLPLWPWCAGPVVGLLGALTRLDGGKFWPWVVVPAVLLNLALAAADARACGRAWAAARARGESASLLDWCGAVHSALGFTWCWLFTLLALGGGRMDSWLGVGLVWGCLLLAPGVFLSGLALTAGAWSDATRAGGALRYVVAAYDTLATAYNACALAAAICVFVWAFGGGVPWAPSFFAAEIKVALAPGINFSQGRGGYDLLVPALLLVVAALGAGVLSTAAIACRAAGGPPDPVAGLAPARRGDAGRAVREPAAVSPTRCPACRRPLALPDHLGVALVRCPACRTRFEADTVGGGLGPRWVLLPLWPWCALAVFFLLRGPTRLVLFWGVVVAAVLLNLALSAADARACGRAWAAARAQGDPAGPLAWCGAAHSALGLTWCLFALMALAAAAGWGGLWFGLVWGCMVIAPGVFLSGLAITAGAWSDARRAGGAPRHAVAAYDTLATAYNACALAVAICAFVWAFGGGVPWAPRFFARIMWDLSPVINLSQGRGGYDFLVPALLLVVAALGAGVLSTTVIARGVAGGPRPTPSLDGLTSGPAPDPPPGPSSRTWDVVWLLIVMLTVWLLIVMLTVGLVYGALTILGWGYFTSINSKL
jgi:hypothetical protein